MCDYSLMGVPNRLAREGEDLITHTFSSGSRGLTPDTEATEKNTVQIRWKCMQGLFDKLFGKVEIEKVAVCVPPGARLLLRDIPEDLRNSLEVGSTEEVTFTQLTAEAYEYRDAVRFENGRELLLQSLKKGQRIKVLQLSGTDEIQPAMLEADFFNVKSMRVDLIASRLIR